MFSSLEEEVVRVLRASLSPRFVASDRVQTGLLAAPATVEPPSVVVSAFAFRLNPDEAASPPRASRSLVQQLLEPNSAGPLLLSHPPLQPLRSVELEAEPAGGRQVLNERDDFTVDYVRATAAPRVRVDHAPRELLHRAAAARAIGDSPARRVSRRCIRRHGPRRPARRHHRRCRSRRLAGKCGAIDGLRGSSQDVVDLGLPCLPGRKVFCVFEAPIVVGGSQLLPTHWRLDYAVDAWQLAVPVVRRNPARRARRRAVSRDRAPVSSDPR